MADATGTPTSNYSFKTIAGTDTAGYTSINSVITSIDTQLIDKSVKSNTIVLFVLDTPTLPAVASVSGYTLVGSALTSGQYTSMGLPAPSAGKSYYWFKKN